MLIDFQNEENIESMEADICIIGAGAAGISLAREFLHTNHQVLLLEGGGKKAEPDTQDLYRSQSVGLSHKTIDGRSRIFGGTTTLWAGQASPFDAIDFAKRDWVPHSGWPLAREDLEPYFQRVEEVMQIHKSSYDINSWPSDKASPPQYDEKKLKFVFSQFSPQPSFAAAYRKELERSKNVRVLLHANVTHLHLHKNGNQLDKVSIQSLNGRKGFAKAKYFVICCGGIETARLLLVSNSVQSSGIGNQNDLVGRFFQDHIHMRAAHVKPYNENEFFNKFCSIYDGNVRYCPKFAASELFQRQKKILNIAGDIFFQADLGAPIRTAKDLVKQARRGNLKHFPGGLSSALWRTVKGFPQIAVAAFRYYLLNQVVRDEVGQAYLGIQCEPTPNPDSRVYLSNEKDALGLPRVNVNWQLSDLDRKTIEMFIEMVAHEFERLGLARVDLETIPYVKASSFPLDIFDSNHHMGTTKMADNPKLGVVDRDSRVHGVFNLYIGSTSVLPTTGFANPTFNSLALCFRMADQIKLKLNETHMRESA